MLARTFEDHFFELITPQLGNMEFVKRHHLEGLLYSRWHQQDFKSFWMKNFYRNSQLQQFLMELDTDLSVDFQIFLIKGASLWKRLYENIGERFMSDIDVYVHKKNLLELSQKLKRIGFKEQSEKKWKANSFKTVFIKKNNNLEIVLEVHTQLFWTQSVSFLKGEKLSKYTSFSKMDTNLEFLHLCTHLAFQHTYISLHWLYEIALYYDNYCEDIDLDAVKAMAIENQVFHSLQSVLWLLKHKFKFNIQLGEAPNLNYLFEKIFTESFLSNPKSQKFKFICLKNLLKDRLRDNLSYNVGWIASR
ncbi:MAG: hypothetical protein HOO06_12985 [Bdellovibrionaceae bacterium]|jgi:hypothetical protein|nr:hypothetical protein [Pseudobdellovibrionaceae bacterium]